MTSALFWLFDLHPLPASYSSPTVLGLSVLMAALVIAAAGIRLWRKRQQSAVLRKLTRSWATAAFWFGAVGGVLIVSRTEDVLFLSMRFLWVLWAVAFGVYLAIQIRLFRARHYVVLPAAHAEDPRSRYLPGRKRRK